MTSRMALIVTSISSPNECLEVLAKSCDSVGAQFILIGDLNSPQDFKLAGCDYYSPSRQRALPFKYSAIGPWRHYARKNVGYLQAIQNGVDRIVETDDDNFPMQGFWGDLHRTAEATVVGDGWFNVYRWYGADAWARGFPLQLVKQDAATCGGLKIERSAYGNVAVWQGLVENDPDVDAIFRLTRGEDVKFEDKGSLILGPGVWAPFNSQNTIWARPAFPLLYLPATCSFRATDIIRGYVALRCLEEIGLTLGFSGVTARQIRNAHDLMKDFREEVEIYLNADRIRQGLRALRLASDSASMLACLRRCYEWLASVGIVREEELSLVDAWSEDIRAMSSN